MMSDEEAIEKYWKLVHKIALAYLRRYGDCVSLGDLTQEGFMGLMHAAELARLKNRPLIYSYAHVWIGQRISRYCKRNMNLVRWPAHSFKDIMTNLVNNRWRHIGEARVLFRGLEVLGEAAIAQPVFFLKVNDFLPHLRGYVDALPERQRYILTRRFDLDHKGASTLDEIGRRIGMTRERVRQLEVEALTCLRNDFLSYPRKTMRGPDPADVYEALERNFSVSVDNGD